MITTQIYTSSVDLCRTFFSKSPERFFGIFCGEIQFCGLGLREDLDLSLSGSEIDFFQMVSCAVFVDSKDNCDALSDQIIKDGIVKGKENCCFFKLFFN